MLTLKIEKVENISDDLPIEGKYCLFMHHGDSQSSVALKRSDKNREIRSYDSDLSLKLQCGTRLIVHLAKDAENVRLGSGLLCVADPGLHGIVLYTPGEASRVLCVLRCFVTEYASDSRRPSGSIPSEPDVGNLQSSHPSVTSDILSHFFSDIVSAKQLIETYKKWAIRCGPLRFIHDSCMNIVRWNDPFATLLVMVMWVWVCRDTQTAVVCLVPVVLLGSLYTLLLLRTGALPLHVIGSPTDIEFVSEDVERNLKFNNQMMSSWCDMYDTIKNENLNVLIPLVSQVPTLWIFVAVSLWIALYIVPTNMILIFIVLVPLVGNCPMFGSNKTTAVVASLLKHAPDTMVFEVYENQRWWLGNWSDKGLAIGTAQIYPWSDITGKVSKNKSEVSPPPGFDWQDLWHVDERGWMYAINFDTDWFHSDQRSSDFVRKRKWIRTARAVRPPTNS